MLQPPSLKSVPRYPVTSTVLAGALAATGFYWAGKSIDAYAMNEQVWAKWELWRALTCTLPHANMFHLAFNLYWVWTFGTVLEEVYGYLKTWGIFALLAFGASLPQFALLSGGVGLSGVGYGLWGMLWVLGRRDARFAGAVDKQTSEVFALWFFLCIALTLTDVMPVANIEHGAGAGLGALLGLAAGSKGAARWGCAAGLAAAILLGVAGSTLLWPRVNLNGAALSRIEDAGVDALDIHDNGNAARLLEIAAHSRRAPAWAWFNLGIAYERLGRHEDALMAFEHAAGMPGATSKMEDAAQTMREALGK